MNKFTQQWTNAAENFSTAINTFTTLANASLENAQKITALQYEAVSGFIEQSANTTKHLFGAKTPVQASNLIKDFAVFSVESSLSKSKEILNVLNKSHASFKDVANSSFKNASESILSSIDKVATLNPAWSKAATASVQKFVNATNKANETIEKVSAQVSTIANKNVESAAQATLSTLKKSAIGAQSVAAR